MPLKQLVSVVCFTTLAACVSKDAMPEKGNETVKILNPNSAEHFPMADSDENNALSLAEFEAFVELEAEDSVGKSKRIKQFGAYERAFGVLDANKDGSVTLAEIEAFQTK